MLDLGALMRGVELAGERLKPVAHLVQAVAISRFDHDVVGAGDRGEVAQQRHVGTADVAREAEGPLLAARADLEVDDGSAEDVTCFGKGKGHRVGHAKARIVVDAFEILERSLGLLLGVERLKTRRGVARRLIGSVGTARGGDATGHLLLASAIAARHVDTGRGLFALATRAAIVAGFGRDGADLEVVAFVAGAMALGGFFLEVAGVRENDVHQIGSGRRDVHLATETVLDQLGQVAAVIDVGVAEDGKVDVLGFETRRQAIFEVVHLVLDGQTRVHEETSGLFALKELEEIKRSRDGASRTKSVKLEHRTAGTRDFLKLTFVHAFFLLAKETDQRPISFAISLGHDRRPRATRTILGGNGRRVGRSLRLKTLDGLKNLVGGGKKIP